MALPKQVQAQLAAAEELEKSLYAPEDDQKDSDSDESKGKEPDTDAEKQAEADKKPETVEAKPADTSPTVVADDFEQKYRTLRGKYDAEVPRLHAQVKDLAEQLQALQEQAAKAEALDDSAKSKEKVSYVTDADRAEFGEELIDVQRRVAKEVSRDYEDRLEAQAKVIEELQSKIADTGSQIGQMSFAQRLNHLVPDFEAVDQDSRWVAWLDGYDPILRAPRRTAAQTAFDAGDAEAVADYVNLFKESVAEAQKPVQGEHQAELERQVTPNRSAGSSRAQNTGKAPRTYSQREMAAAWEKVRVLNSRGQVDEAAKLEAELSAAYVEGRVS